MTSDEMYNVVLELQAITGTNAKKAVLGMYPDMQKLLRLVYHPHIHFNIKPNFNSLETAGVEEFSSTTYELLRKLANGTLSGYAAKSHLLKHYNHLTGRSKNLLVMILNKNLGIGLAAKGINSVWPGLIPTHDIMLAHAFNPEKLLWPVTVSVKLDGLRAIFKDGKFYSRNGNVFRGLEHLEAQMARLIKLYYSREEYKDDSAKPVFDGELIVPGEHFNEISGAIRSFKPSDRVTYHIFDIPSMENSTHIERYEYLEQWRETQVNAMCYGSRGGFNSINFLKHTLIAENYYDEARGVPNGMAMLQLMYREAQEVGHEGVMIKYVNGIYTGARNYTWMKMKAYGSEDCKVIGTFPGKGQIAGLCGGLIVDFKGVEVRVGSGLSMEQRRRWQDEPEMVIGCVAEVGYHEVTPAGSLRHPRLVQLRGDL